MQVQELVLELGFGQNGPLDPALGADEERNDPRVGRDHRTGDGERRIEVPAAAAAGEKNVHCSAERRGLVAPSPITRSRSLPMFIRIPVMTRVRSMLVRPYDMNGRASPVFGSSPIVTPMWRNALITIVATIPTATNCWNLDRAARAIRKPR